MLKEVSGYDPDVRQNREQARAMMRKLGYGPDNRLKIKLFTRDIAFFRTPAVILMDQLKEVWIDAELDAVDTTLFYPRLFRKDFTVGLNAQAAGPDPDPILEAFYRCGSTQNPDGYCSADLDELIEQQSIEADPEKRKQILWAIERKLAEDGARPIILYARAGTCWKPDVKGVAITDNSIFNSNRREDVWLDR
jgi:peptide/nickel transport system substrate-binding protein